MAFWALHASSQVEKTFGETQTLLFSSSNLNGVLHLLVDLLAVLAECAHHRSDTLNATEPSPALGNSQGLHGVGMSGSPRG